MLRSLKEQREALDRSIGNLNVALTGDLARKLSGLGGLAVNLPSWYIHRLTGDYAPQLNLVNNVGFQIYLHESGHEQASRLVLQDPVTFIHEGAGVGFQNFVAHPGIQTLGDWLTGKNNDGGVTYFLSSARVYPWGPSFGPLEPTPIGQLLGAGASSAIVALAGSMTELFWNLGIYEVGRRIYEKHPKLGAYMQAYAISSHISSSSYPIRSIPVIGDVKGGDWIAFASVFPAAAQEPVLVLSAALYTSSLLVYAGLTHKEDLRSLFRTGKEKTLGFTGKLADKLLKRPSAISSYFSNVDRQAEY